jgi:putative oxidoreductase
MQQHVRTILRAVVSVIFLMAAVMKLRDPHQFTTFGYPQGFGILVAIAELCGAAGLWIPKAARLAAIGLILIMVGAIYTHMHIGDPRGGILPVILLFGLVRLAGVRH